jgi:hypothetical protein
LGLRWRNSNIDVVVEEEVDDVDVVDKVRGFVLVGEGCKCGL